MGSLTYREDREEEKNSGACAGAERGGPRQRRKPMALKNVVAEMWRLGDRPSMGLLLGCR